MNNLFIKQDMEQTDEESLNELYKYRMELMNKINLIDLEISRLESEKVKKCNHNLLF